MRKSVLFQAAFKKKKDFNQFSTHPRTNASRIGLILVKLIYYSGKLPTWPVEKNHKFAACNVLGVNRLIFSERVTYNGLIV